MTTNISYEYEGIIYSVSTNDNIHVDFGVDGEWVGDGRWTGVEFEVFGSFEIPDEPWEELELQFGEELCSS